MRVETASKWCWCIPFHFRYRQPLQQQQQEEEEQQQQQLNSISTNETTNMDGLCHDDGNNTGSSNQHHHPFTTTTPLLLGQLVALMASSMNIFSYRLNRTYDLHTQFFQLIGVYMFLSLMMLGRNVPQQHDQQQQQQQNHHQSTPPIFVQHELQQQAETAENDIHKPTATTLVVHKDSLLHPFPIDNALEDSIGSKKTYNCLFDNTSVHNTTTTRTTIPEQESSPSSSSSSSSSRIDSVPGPVPRSINTVIVHYFPYTSFQLHIPWWMYGCMSVLDVFPNFLSLLAYRYSTLTSTTLLGSAFTVPSTMVFARLLLSRTFAQNHYLGVCLCLLGGALTFYLDTESTTSTTITTTDSVMPTPAPYSVMLTSTIPTDVEETSTSSMLSDSSSAYIGDVIAMTAAIFYALGDNIAEYAVKNIDRCEYLGMLGIFGCVQVSILCLWMERSSITEWFHRTCTGVDENTLFHNSSIIASVESDQWMDISCIGIASWATLGLYVGSVVGYYASEAWFLLHADATLLNLSLQSTNLWAILYMTLTSVGGPSLSTLPIGFYAALILVLCGVFVYEGVWKRSMSHQQHHTLLVPVTDNDTENETDTSSSSPQTMVNINGENQMTSTKSSRSPALTYGSVHNEDSHHSLV
jgi:drug/metabolite transporter (DMT)-like permease